MYGPKNSKSALLALATAGGLLAWRNRDKIQGWLSNQMSNVNSQIGNSTSNQPSTETHRRYTDQPYTSETRRMDEPTFGDVNDANNVQRDPYKSGI